MPPIRRKRTTYHQKAPALGAYSASSTPEGVLRGSSPYPARAPATGPYGAPPKGPLQVSPEPSVALRSSEAADQAAAADSQGPPRGGEKASGASHGEPRVSAPEKVVELLSKEIRSLSRGQRKRLGKREAAERRRNFGVYAEALLQQRGAAAEGENPSALDTMNLVGEALREGSGGPCTASFSSNPKKLSNKKRALALQRELRQYSAVLALGAFREDPAAALSTHLNNTLKLQQQKQQPV
ncbi:hypothetical protein cyc_08264 [Cyclospora cayetanensis]|uniref:Uncharacterized protein n=1 Tax=Cyclospora cayetanensis TaxID=88456 RepID=A0A1D3CZ62_9EIME|nr:hypothetical protein cyc_08264 [Cyclospora cayetanensis]